ncbi:hypothetical protein DVS77_14040 [Mycolicibacterium moriokaense]|nr:hypothetical protein DVS77_14040 [Mycolicibacterium moriokaense]
MFSRRVSRRQAVAASCSALIAIGAFASACSNNGGQTPATTTTTTTTTAPSSSAAPPSPTEKEINPTGGNLFTPGHTANPAPNVPPGQHPGLNGTP